VDLVKTSQVPQALLLLQVVEISKVLPRTCTECPNALFIVVFLTSLPEGYHGKLDEAVETFKIL